MGNTKKPFNLQTVVALILEFQGWLISLIVANLADAECKGRSANSRGHSKRDVYKPALVRLLSPWLDHC